MSVELILVLQAETLLWLMQHDSGTELVWLVFQAGEVIQSEALWMPQQCSCTNIKTRISNKALSLSLSPPFSLSPSLLLSPSLSLSLSPPPSFSLHLSPPSSLSCPLPLPLSQPHSLSLSHTHTHTHTVIVTIQSESKVMTLMVNTTQVLFQSNEC